MAQQQIGSNPFLIGNQESWRGDYSQMPPEQAMQERAIARKQQIASLLLSQGMKNTQHQGQMAGRFYVPPSPFQGLAGLGEIFAGLYGGHKLDEQSQGLGKDYADQHSAAVEALIRGNQNVPSVPASQLDQEIPAVPSNLESIIQEQQLPQGVPQINPVRTPTNGVHAVTQGIIDQRFPRFTQEQEMQIEQDPTISRADKGDLYNATGPQVVEPQQTPYQPEIPAVPGQQGPISPGTPERARTPQEFAANTMRGLTSDFADVRHGAQFMAAQNQAKEEKDTNREFLGEQKSADREHALLLGMGKIDQLMTMGLITTATGKQLKEEMMKSQEDIAKRHDATMLEIAKGHDVAKVAQKGAAMSATAQKELIQTEEEMQSSHQAIKQLRSALDINDKAMGFSGAGPLASAGSLLPESVRPKAVDATVSLDNLITGSVLPQLKAIFGGMPTEGERKILLDVSGSTGKTPSQRKDIFERAIQAAEARIKFNAQKAEQLRKGTYFTGEGGLDTTVSPAPASPTGLPPGAKQIGTSGGKPVYQMPDGSKMIAE